MIRRIIVGIIVIIAFAFVVFFLLSGSYRQIIVNATHYRSPKGMTLFQFIAGTGTSSIGEAFTLPGTPSSYPSLSIPDEPTTTNEYAPPPTVIPAYGSSGSSEQESQQQKLDELQAQYQALQAQENTQSSTN